MSELSSIGRSTSKTDNHSDEILNNGRLLIALDMLLETASVTGTAQKLGLQISAVSRLLGQLRRALGNPLFIRSGRGLVPTPYAETLRPTIRALAAGIDAVFENGQVRISQASSFDPRWNVPAKGDIAGLVVRSLKLLDGAPSPEDLADRFSRIDDGSHPHERIAKYCATISTGAGHRRPLTIDEARDAMALVVAGEADPIQIGALFGIIQQRGVTATELAGFVQAVKAHIGSTFGKSVNADLDWPCHTSPNHHNPPWYFHAARLVALAGHRILLHGSSGSGSVSGRHEIAARAAGIPLCGDAAKARSALKSHRIAYIPLSALCPQAYRLMGLHRLLGMRNPIHDTISLVNPGSAKVSLLGVSKPSYKELHRDTARILGETDVAILGNVRGPAQFNPFRGTMIHRLVKGEAMDILVKSVSEPRMEPHPHSTTLEFWQGVWTGATVDQRAEKIIIATAASALLAVSRHADARFDEMLELAARLWKKRFHGEW